MADDKIENTEEKQAVLSEDELEHVSGGLNHVADVHQQGVHQSGVHQSGVKPNVTAF